MIDPSIREKYTLTYSRTYIRPEINKIRNSKLSYIPAIISAIILFFGPLLKLAGVSDHLWIPLWLANFVFIGIACTLDSKKGKIEDLLNTCMIQEFIMTDKTTGDKHPGYAFIQGYNLILQGTASAVAMAAHDGSSIWELFEKEGEKKYYAAVGQKNQNIKRINSMLHSEAVQNKSADLIVGNKGFFRDMDYIFFDTYRPLKKKFKGRYYAVPGYRGIEQKILIPADCGFEEAIKDDMNFVYYKNA